MRQRIVAGIAAGLVAGVALAVVMRGLGASAGDGSRITMITYAAHLVRAESPLAGWLAYIAYAGVLGALFGPAVGVARMSGPRAALLGLGWGIGWLVVVALGLVPALLGERPLSASALRVLRDVGGPLLIGHVVCGLVLGTGFRLVLDRLSPPGSSGHTQAGMRRAA